jgi:hypothetical protein
MLIHETKILRSNPARPQPKSRQHTLNNTRPAADRKRTPAVMNRLRSHWILEDGNLQLAWSLDDTADEKPGPRRKSRPHRPVRVQVCLNVPLTRLWKNGTIDPSGPGVCFLQTNNSFEQCAA